MAEIILTTDTAREYARAYFAPTRPHLAITGAEYRTNLAGDHYVRVIGTLQPDGGFPFAMNVWVEQSSNGTSYLKGEW